MPFEKGVSGNLKGKPKGIQNKDKQLLRAFLTEIVEDDSAKRKLKTALNELTGKEYITAYLSLTEYCVGKMRTTELVNADDSVLKINLIRTIEDE